MIKAMTLRIRRQALCNRFPAPEVRMPAGPAPWHASAAASPDNPDDLDDLNGGDDADQQVVTKARTRTKKPNLYRVLLLNDDYTPMEFVVHVLERFFNKDRATATQIMLHVHQRGIGVCGVYTYEVAEAKVTQVLEFSRQNQQPLQCVMEKT